MSRLDKAKNENTSTNEDLVASLGKNSKSREPKKISTKAQMHESTNTQKYNSSTKASCNKSDARLNINVDPNLLIKLKVYGAQNHKTLKALVEEAIYKTYTDLK